jgi:hypothetical protein
MKHYSLWSVLVIMVFSFGLATAASAHEPRYIKDDQLVIIKNPEISQAFYSGLKGREARYLIDLKKEQDLYFQILVPDLPGVAKDKTVAVDYLPELGKPAIVFTALNPDSAVWQNYYEEYGGDNYFKGPSVKKMGEPGYYLIKVSSPGNTGKYVLVVGEKEEFPPLEMAKALIVIPQLKKDFFQEPLTQWFNGKAGKYFGLGLIIIIIVGYLFHKFRQIYK